ncbi:Sodium/glucose cotransporter [bacterium HR16]|nr:Sodium/glucose cotransporter [bacterium HR16]
MEPTVHVTAIDYIIIAAYLVLAIVIGVLLGKRASKSMAEYFAAGRTLPWWLAGTSMVATTFAADTPLAVSGLVRSQGIAGNWFWWNGVFANMLGTFLFAPLWRRSGVLTDLEFIQLRYDGKAAHFLRGFRVLYSSLVHNSIVMGWVILAAAKIVRNTFGWNESITLGVLVVITFIYTLSAGLWGVVLTDFLQFILAMTGAIWLGIAALNAAGGSVSLVQQIGERGLMERLALIPSPQTRDLWLAFLAYMLLQWWSVGRPDGEGYIAQRILASRDERHATLAFLWFAFAHYVLRPWWWILVGLASLLLLPGAIPKELGGDEGAYPILMGRLLPAGILGVMIASLLAAFMSTMDTQMNWAASYLTNDFYRAYIRKNAPDGHYVLMGRVATTVILLLGVAASLVTEEISKAWMLLAGLNAGIGTVSVLRWLWWRVSAWSELGAMVTALVANVVMHVLGWMKVEPFTWLIEKQGFPLRLLIIVSLTQVAWVAATLLTRPEPREKLVEFYRRVRPPGWWGSIAQEAGVPPSRIGWQWLFGWLGGVFLIYGGLFALGGLLLWQKAWLIGGGIACLLGIVGVRLGLQAVARQYAEASEAR